jgi:hypothetical protein
MIISILLLQPHTHPPSLNKLALLLWCVVNCKAGTDLKNEKMSICLGHWVTLGHHWIVESLLYANRDVVVDIDLALALRGIWVCRNPHHRCQSVSVNPRGPNPADEGVLSSLKIRVQMYPFEWFEI